MRYLHQQKGFTLVETLVAISILIIAIAGPMTMAARGLQSSYHAKSQLVAVHLAQEAIEFVRMRRDNYALEHSGSSAGWFSAVDAVCKESPDISSNHGCGIEARDVAAIFLDCGATGSTACLLKYDAASASSERGIYTKTDGANSLFTREIFIVDPGTGGKEVLVTVKVSWQSNLLNMKKEVVLQSRIFDAYR